jgi:REP element-mobilizing transposase RayT
VPGGLYHAVLRGNHREAIFASGGDYLRFEAVVARALERYGASLFAYCWMTNHVHLAIRVADAPLGAIMNIVASRYARAKQRAVDTTGHLFERRYRARLVDAERYLLALVRYIHLNPVRAGMVGEPAAWRWSSHRAYLGAMCPVWLSLEPVMGQLGTSADAARAVYRRFMNEPPAETDRENLSTAPRPGRGTPTRVDASVAIPREVPSRQPTATLEAIAADVLRSRAVTLEDLRSKRRSPALVAARVQIARRVLRDGAGNLSQVARYLNRSPSTLSGHLHGEPPVAVATTEEP